MNAGMNECRCSILNAREEKLLDEEGRIQSRLICNRCGAILDTVVVSRFSGKPGEPETVQHEKEAEA